MSRLPLLFLLISFLAPPAGSSGQQLLKRDSNSAFKEQHRIYALSDSSARRIAKEAPYVDGDEEHDSGLEQHFKQVIREQEAVADTNFEAFRERGPPPGYYLHAELKGMEVEVRIELLSPFSLFAFPSENGTRLFVSKDRTWVGPEELGFFKGDKPLPYDPNSQAFILSNADDLSNYSMLRMEWKGKHFFFKAGHRYEYYLGETLMPDMPRYTFKERLYMSPITGPIIRSFRRVTANLLKVLGQGGSMRFSLEPEQKKTGYFALNKPRYQPGDTVKWKAYLLDHEKEPIDGLQDLKMAEVGSEKANTLVPDVRPERAGIYHGAFAIPDSLTLGKEHFLFIGGDEGTPLVSQKFLYKDRSLDQERLEAKLLGEEHRTWKPIRVRLMGADATGRPLKNAIAKWTLETDRIGAFPKGTQKHFIPDTIQEGQMKWNGIDTLTFSDTLLPPCDITLRFSARMTGPSGRLHDTVIIIDAEKRTRSFKVEDRDTVIRVELQDQDRPMEGKGELIRMSPLANNEKDTVEFPFRWRPSGRYQKLVFRSGGAEKKIAFEEFVWQKDRPHAHLSEFEPKVKPIEVQGADPWQVFLKNPRKLTVRYQLIDLEQGKEFYHRASSKDSIPLKLPSRQQAPFYLRYQFLWEGEEVKKGKRLLPDDRPPYRSDTLMVHAPDTVRPGERATVEIEAEKADGTPIPDLELTAWAFSSQFQGKVLNHEVGDIFSEPRGFPDPEQSLERYYRSRDLELGRGGYGSKWPIEAQDRALLEQKRMDLFRSHEPPDAYYERRYAIEGERSQFTAFIAEERDLKAPVLVDVDGEPLYYHKSGCPYTMKVSPGYHRVRIRTKDRAYRLDSVRFNEGEKLELSLEADGASAEFKIDTMPDTLTKKERADIRDSWIALKKNEERIMIQQKDKLFYMPKGGRQGVVWAGPFREDRARILRIGPRSISSQRIEIEPFHAYQWDEEKGIKKESLKAMRIDHMDPGYHSWVDHPIHEPGWVLGTDAHLKSWMQRAMDEAPSYSEAMGPLTLSKMEDLTAFYGQAELRVERQGDRQGPALFRLIQKKDSSVLNFGPMGDAFRSSHLKHGAYRAILITPCDTLSRSISIKKHGTSYLSFESRSCDKKGLEGAAHSGSYAASDQEGDLSGRLVGKKKGGLISYSQLFLYKKGVQVKKTRTDEQGGFRFEDLKGGRYSIRAEAPTGDPVPLMTPFEYPQKGGLHLRIPVRKKEIALDQNAGSSTINGMPARGVARVAERSSSSFHVSDIAVKAGGDGSNSSTLKAFRAVSDPDFTTGGVPAQYGDPEGSSSYKLRKNVDREYAYWVPDLKTNEAGKASFRVPFPGRIANWQNVVFGKRKGAITLEERFSIHAVKPRELHLYLPRFLRTGDSLTFPARTIDRTDTSLEARTSVHLADSTLLDARYRSKEQHRMEAGLPVFSEPDTPKVKGLHLSNDTALQDGLEKELPVRDHRSKQTDGELLILEGDTSLTVRDSLGEGRYRVKILANGYRVLENELQGLKDYPHACNEQASSKLKGLLALQEVQGNEFSEKGMSERLVRKLSKAQNDDGSWGWWPDGEEDLTMTLYVRGALHQAKEMGYQLDEEVLEKSKTWITGEIDPLDGESRILRAAVQLVQQGVDPGSDSLLATFDPAELSGMDKLRYSFLASRDTNWKGLERLLGSGHRTKLGGRYWKQEGKRDFRATDLIATLLAYRAIRNNDPKHRALSHIRRYLFGSLRKGRSWNTFETARIVSTLFSEEQGMKQKRAQHRYKFRGAVDTTLKGGEHQLLFENADGRSLKLSSSSPGTSYLMIERDHFSDPNRRVDNGFDVKTRLTKKGKKGEQFRKGDRIDLNVQVSVEALAEHVMIEVPIPASMEYRARPQWGNEHESHREYHKERCYIFCEELPEGEHRFKIPLSARFKGRSIMPPATASLMYFPVVNGRNTQKEVFVTAKE